MYGEKAWRQLHKNAASCIEQILEATLHKTAAVWPPTLITKSIQVRQIRHVGNCWRSKDGLISDILLWTPSHGQAKVEPMYNSIYKRSVLIQEVAWRTSQKWWTIGTGGKRGSGRSVLTVQHDIYTYIYIYIYSVYKNYIQLQEFI